jgi:hypothetical protein
MPCCIERFIFSSVAREDRGNAKFYSSGKVMPAWQFGGEAPPHLAPEALE